MFCDRRWNICGLKTLTGKKMTAVAALPMSPHHGRSHTARTAAKINKVKDLPVIFLKVSLAN